MIEAILEAFEVRFGYLMEKEEDVDDEIAERVR